jgi:SAM-dependent methyltransferase
LNLNYYRQHSRDYFERTVTADAAAILQPVVDLVPPPARVLDVGCGSGRDLAWLRAKGYSGFGIEAAPELARRARHHCGCPILVADFTTYPLSNFQADLIIAVGSLVHIPHRQLSLSLEHLLNGFEKKMARGGRHPHLYLSFKAGMGTRQEADGRVFYLWRDAALRSVFADLGLDIIRSFAQPSALAGARETSWLGYLLGVGSVGG